MRITIALLLLLAPGCEDPTMRDAVRDWASASCMRVEHCDTTQLPVGVCALNVERWYCERMNCEAPFDFSPDWDACLSAYESASCAETPLACVPQER